jgi:hypothetical protein
MKGKRAIVLAACILLALSSCGQEGGRYSATLITDGEHAFADGETVEGDLLIAGGSIKLEEDSRLAGSAYVMGGTIEVAGEIDGSLSMIGGEASLGPTARVAGDVDVGSGTLARSPEARVLGEVSTGTGSGVRVPLFPEWTIIPTSGAPSAVERIIKLVVNTVVVAALAFFVVRFLPRPVSRVGEALVRGPVVAGALGLLTLIVAPSLLLLMAFTVILIPVSLLGTLLVGAAVLYGWIAIDSRIGQRLACHLGREIRPATAALLGTLLFVLVVDVSGFVPVVRAVVPVLAAAAGLGAVLLTRFGTTSYVPHTEPDADAGSSVVSDR